MTLASAPQAGPLGLAVVVLLGVAVVFLGRSLSRHLGRVPESFDPPEHPPEQPPGERGPDEDGEA